MIRLTCAALMAAVMAVSYPAGAWGPAATESIVTMASHILTRESNVRLNPLVREIRAGARVSDAELDGIIPGAASNPVAAIQSELYLLQTARGDRVDPYYAFRLGVLGKLVAQTTAPLAMSNSPHKSQYYADIDGRIQRATLRPSPRRTVDPPSYFQRLRSLVGEREPLLERDYQTGLGADGVATGGLNEDASRSLDAVADVWYTILTTSAASANISESRLREYFLDSVRFYIERGNLSESEAAFARMDRQGLLSPDLEKSVADIYYDAERYPQAMKHYEAVLAAAPGRRDVMERIAGYYIEVGDAALDDGKLQEALQAFQRAVESNPLHEDAERRRLETQSLITARLERLDSVRSTLETAQNLETRAQDAAEREFYAEAVRLLREARDLYENVTDEFPQERQTASLNRTRVNSRIQQMMQELASSAQRFTGSGQATDARYVARQSLHRLDSGALRTMAAEQYIREMRSLQDELRSRMDTVSAP